MIKKSVEINVIYTFQRRWPKSISVIYLLLDKCFFFVFPTATVKTRVIILITIFVLKNVFNYQKNSVKT